MVELTGRQLKRYATTCQKTFLLLRAESHVFQRFKLAKQYGLSTAIHMFWHWLTNSIIGQPNDDNLLEGLLMVPVQLESEPEYCMSLRFFKYSQLAPCTDCRPSLDGGHTEHWELPGLMHPTAFHNGQWRCLPDRVSHLLHHSVAAGPGPFRPNYPAGSAVLHNYQRWAAGDCDVLGCSFVWDSQKGAS